MNPPKKYETVLNDLTLETVTFVVIWIIGIFAGGLIIQFLLQQWNVNGVNELLEAHSNVGIQQIRLIQGINSTFTYIIPSVIVAGFLFRKRWAENLFLNEIPDWKNLLLSLLIIGVSGAFISFVYYYNTILLPQDQVATDVLQMEQKLMEMNSLGDFLSNLLVFGLIAGIGEELFFRGLFQRFVTQWSQNIHLGALITALFFTLMHFQPEGFIPRLILSLFFSYFLILTGRLWISVVIHIVFNSYQVFLYYFTPNLVGSVDKVSFVPWSYALFSLLCTVLLWITFVKVNNYYSYSEILNNKNINEFKS
jgi:membrane protease YdiL (CAAX protease family)